jgi:hypothetical protein
VIEEDGTVQTDIIEHDKKHETVAKMSRVFRINVNMRRGWWEALGIEFNEVDVDDVLLGSMGKS